MQALMVDSRKKSLPFEGEEWGTKRRGRT